MLAALALALVLNVTPNVGFAPATLRIKVQVTPQADNRLVRVVLDNGEYFRSTDIQLDGEATPRTQSVFEFRDVPAGDYEMVALLYDKYAKLVMTAKQIIHLEGRQ